MVREKELLGQIIALEKEKAFQTQISTTQGTPCNINTLDVEIEDDFYEETHNYHQFRHKSVRITSDDKSKRFMFEQDQDTRLELLDQDDDHAFDKNEESDKRTLATEINVEIFDDDIFYQQQERYQTQMVNESQFDFMSPSNKEASARKQALSLLETSQIQREEGSSNISIAPSKGKVMVRVRNPGAVSKRSTQSFLIPSSSEKEKSKPNLKEQEKPTVPKTQEEIDQELRESSDFKDYLAKVYADLAFEKYKAIFHNEKKLSVQGIRSKRQVGRAYPK